MNRCIQVAAGLALLVAGLAIVGLASGQAQIATLDEATPLTDESTIDDWQSGANVTVEPTQLDMTISLAREPEAVGIDRLGETGITTLYVRVQYDETIPRTVRFHVPREYWTPYPDASVSPVDDGPSAAYEPTLGSEHTAVTIDVDGKTDAIYPVNQRAAWAFAARERTGELVGNATGIEVPSFAAGQQWQYIEPTELTAEQGRAAIESKERDAVVQFDADPSSETRWENARACGDGGRRVCTFTVDGDNRTYVLSRSADAPRVRYKLGGDLWDSIKGAFSELGGLLDDIPDLGEVF